MRWMLPCAVRQRRHEAFERGAHPERVLDGQHGTVDQELLHSLQRGVSRCASADLRLLTSNACSNWSKGAGVQLSYASSDACSL